MPSVAMQPTLDELQLTINTAVQHILSVFKAVAHWTKVTSIVIFILIISASITVRQRAVRRKTIVCGYRLVTSPCLLTAEKTIRGEGDL